MVDPLRFMSRANASRIIQHLADSSTKRAENGSYWGSPPVSLLMMQISRCIQHTPPQQIKFGTSVADALDHFQSIDLGFKLPVRPQQRCCFDSCIILAKSDGKRAHRSQPTV